MSNVLGKLKTTKMIPANFPSISHLPGSKMINDEDKLIGQREGEWLTVRTKEPKDLVIVTEKIDGMNAGVYRKDDKLWAITRKGYDVRTNPCDWIKSFSNYVEDNAERFFQLLLDEERLCGEWMIHQHTLRYKIKGEPFIAFDLIRGNHRSRYTSFMSRVKDAGFEHTGLVHIGTAISVEYSMKLLGEGFHGVVGGEPEGVVYRYESHENGYWFSGKYVANQLLGKEDTFKANDQYAFNEIKSRYKKYFTFDIR